MHLNLDMVLGGGAIYLYLARMLMYVGGGLRLDPLSLPLPPVMNSDLEPKDMLLSLPPRSSCCLYLYSC